MNKTLWVLDTNVVLDLFYFNDVATRPLRQAFDAGRIACAANAATLAEWRRVLGYPEFGLDETAQAALYARYVERVKVCPEGGAVRPPRCRDADDQKFLELAARCGALLVSKDRALLDLRRRVTTFAIVAPAEAVARLDSAEAHDLSCTSGIMRPPLNSSAATPS